jgi:hypothetical protein
METIRGSSVSGMTQNKIKKTFKEKVRNKLITVNVPLILKMREIIFLRTNYFMGHFKGPFEGGQKSLGPTKYPEKWSIK